MWTLIATEEYKELLIAKENAKALNLALEVTNSELQKVQAEIKELLLMLTKGKTSPQWVLNRFEWLEIETAENIAKYISEHYLNNSSLRFTKENDDE